MEPKIWVAWQQQLGQGPEPRHLAVGIVMVPGEPVHMREAFAREVMALYPEVIEVADPAPPIAPDLPPDGERPLAFAKPNPLEPFKKRRK